MSDVSALCKNSIETVSLEITKTQKELGTRLEKEEREEINVTLEWQNKLEISTTKKTKQKVYLIKV